MTIISYENNKKYDQFFSSLDLLITCHQSTVN